MTESMQGVRLQKVLASAGIASRRASERLIVEGRVSVNGEVVRELGTRVHPDRDDVRVDGRRVRAAQEQIYLLLNKPRGYVTTRSDPEGRPTVMDLLGKIREYLYPVGRLDFDSEGLLLMTNDGDLAAKLTHPRHGVEREYEARVLGEPAPRDLARLARGISIEERRTGPAVVTMRRTGAVRGKTESVLSITIHEGRKRQVRLMCEAIGHPVIRLKRVRIGPIADATLRSGEVRRLTKREVEKLKKEVGDRR